MCRWGIHLLSGDFVTFRVDEVSEWESYRETDEMLGFFFPISMGIFERIRR